jgi:glycosyltransferase involved in cell wall biosynthesis
VIEPAAPFFSVVVPSLGDGLRLTQLLDAMERQSYPRELREMLLVLDGAAGPPEVDARVRALGGEVIRLPARRGPGAARNAGAARARGAFLAFTEDDVIPAADWLERGAARLAADPSLDVLVGATEKPGGRDVRIGPREFPLYLPTNLFVRRELFLRIGGYHEKYFDSDRGIYFREDSDLGFTLEEAGARVARTAGARVTHPEEHPAFLDPLRWALRYEMDPLLKARHPALFRERIEVQSIGPVILRRPIVRACVLYLVALAGAFASWIARAADVAIALLALALLALVPLWAKWRFAPLRLPLLPVVPFVLVASYWRGRGRIPRAAPGR